MVSRATLRAMVKAQKKNAVPVKTDNYGPPPTKPAPDWLLLEVPYHFNSHNYNPLETHNGRNFEGLPGGNELRSMYTDEKLGREVLRGTEDRHPIHDAIRKYNDNAREKKKSPIYVMQPIGRNFESKWDNGNIRADPIRAQKRARMKQLHETRKRKKIERKERVERAKAARNQAKK